MYCLSCLAVVSILSHVSAVSYLFLIFSIFFQIHPCKHRAPSRIWGRGSSPSRPILSISVFLALAVLAYLVTFLWLTISDFILPQLILRDICFHLAWPCLSMYGAGKNLEHIIQVSKPPSTPPLKWGWLSTKIWCPKLLDVLESFMTLVTWRKERP